VKTSLRITAVLAAALLAGCVQWREYELGVPIARAEVPDPTDGWTVTQVMEQFGPPLRMSRDGSGYVMAWEFWDIDEYKVGVGLGFTGADFLNVDWGKANATGDFMLLNFDQEHRLVSASFEEWKRDAGGGQGVQAFISAVDVVEVDDLLEELSQHRWGSQSLRRLPVTLNQQNRLDSGEAGLEQRGGTRVVGQHSLEMR
jgi:hypothetical protein